MILVALLSTNRHYVRLGDRPEHFFHLKPPPGLRIGADQSISRPKSPSVCFSDRESQTYSFVSANPIRTTGFRCSKLVAGRARHELDKSLCFFRRVHHWRWF